MPKISSIEYLYWLTQSVAAADATLKKWHNVEIKHVHFYGKHKFLPVAQSQLGVQSIHENISYPFLIFLLSDLLDHNKAQEESILIQKLKT